MQYSDLRDVLEEINSKLDSAMELLNDSIQQGANYQ